MAISPTALAKLQGTLPQVVEFSSAMRKIGIIEPGEQIAFIRADAGHDGEKCLASWCAGCTADDDYDLAIIEAQAVQSMNTRSQKEKTYHLLVSFRPEDEAKLTPEIFQAIEKRFAAALGYTEHQRHCGVHKNTSNIHMHIAYRLVTAFALDTLTANSVFVLELDPKALVPDSDNKPVVFYGGTNTLPLEMPNGNNMRENALRPLVCRSSCYGCRAHIKCFYGNDPDHVMVGRG